VAPAKPSTLPEYRKWLREEHSVTVDERLTNYHESVALKLRDDFIASPAWKGILGELKEFDAEYQIRSTYPLLMNAGEQPEVLVKGFDSFILKTFRQNVIDNRGWPSPPRKGWLLPDNWYERINDVIRTSLVVKYLDGVEFMANEIVRLCEDLGVRVDVAFLARDEGYYAAHVYLRQEVAIPQLTWDAKRITSQVEIQITTQLQDVIRKLLHRYYADRRTAEPSREKWQWKYKDDEFVANYLGHILHYVEGMIMEVRDRQDAPTTPTPAPPEGS
jgi:ppGpp synthetase/RelA/SpoT-type nucleotidyltranferase